MHAGIVLIHGYSGLPENVLPLTLELEKTYGKDSVNTVLLPGHGSEAVPLFDKDAFAAAVAAAVDEFKSQGRKVVLIGHSTGGVIALSAISRYSLAPSLLILAAVPKKIDAFYLERWSGHRSNKKEIPFSSVAQMISTINTAGSDSYRSPFPVLVLHGMQDGLVPPAEARAWEADSFEGVVRTVLIPKAGHDLFRGENGTIAIEVSAQFIADVLHEETKEEEDIITAVAAVEPEVKRFITASPFSRRHMAASASGRTAAGLKPLIPSRVPSEPIITNIEITTRCNMRCPHCARTRRGVAGKDMPVETFRTILGLLPHAYRVTLVGLGETLLHPGIVDLVGAASAMGRRVALVTNGMLLDERLSQELLNAGLESIVFSLDAATQEVASNVRPGSDLDLICGNIRRFVELAKSARPVSTAVFSAVSANTVSAFDRLTELVAGLGVHVMMVSDLNFRENTANTLWKNIDDRMISQIRTGVTQSFKRNLPVLSVHGLEEFGLWKRYSQFLLLPPDRVYQRSARHSACFSPWQTIPVTVSGEVTLCDCQPEVVVGNILSDPFSEIWNGEVFRGHRSRMKSDDPPEACRICPRF